MSKLPKLRPHKVWCPRERAMIDVRFCRNCTFYVAEHSDEEHRACLF